MTVPAHKNDIRILTLRGVPVFVSRAWLAVALAVTIAAAFGVRMPAYYFLGSVL